MPYFANPSSIPNHYRYPEGLHRVGNQSMSYPGPQLCAPPGAFVTYVAGPPPGNYYAAFPSPRPQPPPPAYSPGPSPGSFAHTSVQWINAAPSPPPPRSSKRESEKAKGSYKTAEVAKLKFHVLTPRRDMSASDFFRCRNSRPGFQCFDLPTSMSMQEFFKKIGAKGKDAVVEEAVEEGDGVWSHGAKLVRGELEKDAKIGAIRWKRGVGLEAAAGEPIWVLCRKREEGDD